MQTTRQKFFSFEKSLIFYRSNFDIKKVLCHSAGPLMIIRLKCEKVKAFLQFFFNYINGNNCLTKNLLINFFNSNTMFSSLIKLNIRWWQSWWCKLVSNQIYTCSLVFGFLPVQTAKPLLCTHRYFFSEWALKIIGFYFGSNVKMPNISKRPSGSWRTKQKLLLNLKHCADNKVWK